MIMISWKWLWYPQNKSAGELSSLSCKIKNVITNIQSDRQHTQSDKQLKQIQHYP